MNTTSVIILSKNPVLAGQLERFLRCVGKMPSIASVNCIHDAQLQTNKQNTRTILIFTMQVPVMEDLECIRRLRSNYPELLIIATSPHDAEDYEDTVKMVGAIAYVAESDLVEQLIPTIQHVVSGIDQ